MSYTIIAEDHDTFLLSIPRKDMLVSFPDRVIEKMTQNCLEKVQVWQQRAAGLVNVKISRSFADHERKLTLKRHIKTNFPNATRDVQRKLIDRTILDQCGKNEKVFLSNKIFQHDYDRLKARRKTQSTTLQQETHKSGVQYAHDRNERRKHNCITDEDVLRLQKVKDQVFPVYDYEKLMQLNNQHRIGPGVLDFHEQSSYDDLKLKNKRAMAEHQRQKKIIAMKEMTGMLSLPSVQSYMKKIEEVKNKM